MSPSSHSGRSSSPPRSSSPNPLDLQQQKEARLKRRIAELELQVASQSAPPQPRATYKILRDDGPRDQKGRVTLRPHRSPLVGEYDRRQELEEKREEEGDDTPIVYTDEQQCLYRGFEEFRKYIPAIKSVLLKMESNELTAMYSQLQKGATGVFSDDINSVRAAMVDFVNVPGAKDPLFSSQTHMHLFTAPASAKKLKEQINKERQAANGSDAENVRPSDINERPCKKRRVTAPATSKKSVANKIAMRHVTGRSIAYAAVHHRFALSDAPSWNEVDGDFDYILYYNNIIDWFENAPGPIAQKEVDDLLAWWDQCVFKNGGRPIEEPSQASASILTMREQRAARELV
ncbi:hypothetical protein MVEN_00112400 [Mycena venus]|uniref:Uncharacterized protein n=1 Tax=Mycena venus TaxID=2733690 RepID=A0A8H7DFJ3_9AGAR|nr:hypothetical protein MVEN_00112400 [Mycena venus]